MLVSVAGRSDRRLIASVAADRGDAIASCSAQRDRDLARLEVNDDATLWRADRTYAAETAWCGVHTANADGATVRFTAVDRALVPGNR